MTLLNAVIAEVVMPFSKANWVLSELSLTFLQAFSYSPACFCQTFADGLLSLKGQQLSGDEKCPNDPFESYSSLMVGKCSDLKMKKKRNINLINLINIINLIN